MERALFAQLLTAPVAEMSIFPQSQSASRRRTPLVLVFLLRTFLSVLVSLSPICFCPAPEQSAAASPLWLVRPAQVDFPAAAVFRSARNREPTPAPTPAGLVGLAWFAPY